MYLQAKIKANKPNSIDTISQKLDISQLNEQHNQQTNELKTIQQNHQVSFFFQST